MSEKRIPLRKCLGCGQMKDKSTLLRLIKAPDGNVIPDIGGKAQCRGAYLCKNAECLAAAKKARRIERAFKCRVSDETYILLSDCFSER